MKDQRIAFIALRLPHTATVVDRDGEVRPLPHLVRHSPGGFSWGYGGSGPADLARSVLDLFTDTVNREGLYMAFKSDVIAKCKGDTEISAVAIRRWVEDRTATPARHHSTTT